MNPIFFTFPVPEFLRGFLPDEFTMYSYGVMIALGAMAGTAFAAYRANKLFGAKLDTTVNLLIVLLLASFIGGKLFFFLENPVYYFGDLSHIVDEGGGGGFVFYGSLIFAIPSMLIFFKKNDLPIGQMLDVMAYVACIVYAFGRMGCFMAGCCHGVPTDGFLGVTFTNPLCSAEPLNTPLHPTQLYSVLLAFVIGAVLYLIEKRKKFDGQLFVTYLALYAVGRSLIEIFRGDEERGFVIGGLLSHSQLIAVLMLLGCGAVYYLKTKKTA